jgi:hypothetical protein
MTLIESTIETFATRLAKVGETMDLVIAAKGENVRPAVEALAEQLIAFLDATMPDPDLEEEPEGDGYADDEPSLGAPELVNLARAWRQPGDREDCEIDLGTPGDYSPKSQVFSDYTFGSRDGREEENEHSDADGGYATGSGTCDDEPSLGSLDSRMNQTRWAMADREGHSWYTDLEHDPADPPKGQGLDTDEREWDPAENGIADMDGLAEQCPEYAHTHFRVE